MLLHNMKYILFPLLFCTTINYIFLILQVESIYKKAHEAIRSDPSHTKKENKQDPAKQKRWNKRKLTLAERKNRIKQRKASYIKKLQAQGEA